MIVRDLEAKRRLVARLLAETPAEPQGDLRHVAAEVLTRREELLAAAARYGTPCYLFDGVGLRRALRAFAETFGARIPGHRPFYAVKSNHHPLVVEAAAQEGFGLDVSSGRELRQALSVAVEGLPILFSGPAKSEDDLALALAHGDRVTVQLDSFRELERLGALTARLGLRIGAGVRVSSEQHGAWSKFGIPLPELGRFFQAAAAHPGVDLRGVQFHLSWNRDAAPYVRTIEHLASQLSQSLSAAQRAALAFIDFGGGYRPHRLEGYFPADDAVGGLIAAADAHFGEPSEFTRPYYVKDSIPLAEYAAAIGAAIDRHLRPLLRCEYYSEPGRIISTYAMHILLRVVDKKRDDLVILDGGINMVGWERYLHIYCPVVNLTRPAEEELELRLGGSLCDCEDLWGARCFASAVEEGDVLVVPYQGAYTFCVAQDFIRPIPPVHPL